jgi:hypothetical protein
MNPASYIARVGGKLVSLGVAAEAYRTKTHMVSDQAQSEAPRSFSSLDVIDTIDNITTTTSLGKPDTSAIHQACRELEDIQSAFGVQNDDILVAMDELVGSSSPSPCSSEQQQLQQTQVGIPLSMPPAWERLGEDTKAKVLSIAKGLITRTGVASKDRDIPSESQLQFPNPVADSNFFYKNFILPKMDADVAVVPSSSSAPASAHNKPSFSSAPMSMSMCMSRPRSLSSASTTTANPSKPRSRSSSVSIAILDDGWEAICAQFKCNICLTCMAAPTIIGCGHSFCGGCLDEYLSRCVPTSSSDSIFLAHACPMCRKDVSMALYERHLDGIIHSSIDALCQRVPDSIGAAYPPYLEWKKRGSDHLQRLKMELVDTSIFVESGVGGCAGGEDDDELSQFVIHLLSAVALLLLTWQFYKTPRSMTWKLFK